MCDNYNTPLEELQEHLDYLNKQIGRHLNTEYGNLLEKRIMEYEKAINILNGINNDTPY